MAGIAPILPVTGVPRGDPSDDTLNQPLPDSVGPLGEGGRYRDAAVAGGSDQSNVGGSLGGAASIDESVLRHLMHGLTFQQRHQVYLRARAWLSRRGSHALNDEDDIEQIGLDSEASFTDFLALNVALRSMQGRGDSSSRDQSSVDDLLARRDALWEASRASILQWAPGSEAERTNKGAELPGVTGTVRGFPAVAGSQSALDLLRRLVLPHRGNVSDAWLRQALTELSQPGKRFARGDNTLQQLTALRLAGFALTASQAYELAGRLDKAWRRGGLPSRMPQLQLTEKILECAGAPGNVRALCKIVAADRAGQPLVERAVMTTIYRAMMDALPPQVWPEDGARLKFQDGVSSQLREMEPKALLSYRRPLAAGNAPSDVGSSANEQVPLLWS